MSRIDNKLPVCSCHTRAAKNIHAIATRRFSLFDDDMFSHARTPVDEFFYNYRYFDDICKFIQSYSEFIFNSDRYVDLTVKFNQFRVGTLRDNRKLNDKFKGMCYIFGKIDISDNEQDKAETTNIHVSESISIRPYHSADSKSDHNGNSSSAVSLPVVNQVENVCLPDNAQNAPSYSSGTLNVSLQALAKCVNVKFLDTKGYIYDHYSRGDHLVNVRRINHPVDDIPQYINNLVRGSNYAIYFPDYMRKEVYPVLSQISSVYDVRFVHPKSFFTLTLLDTPLFNSKSNIYVYKSVEDLAPLTYGYQCVKYLEGITLERIIAKCTVSPSSNELHYHRKSRWKALLQPEEI